MYEHFVTFDFSDSLAQLARKWNDVILAERSGNATIDVHSWLNKATFGCVSSFNLSWSVLY
jgi:hypothetical protein